MPVGEKEIVAVVVDRERQPLASAADVTPGIARTRSSARS